jgi:hypothetical protein
MAARVGERDTDVGLGSGILPEPAFYLVIKDLFNYWNN